MRFRTRRYHVRVHADGCSCSIIDSHCREDLNFCSAVLFCSPSSLVARCDRHAASMEETSSLRSIPDQGPLINQVSIAHYVAAVLVVSLRFYTRGVVIRKLGLDDYLILVAVVSKTVHHVVHV
jgi:hypothetical protein